MTADEIQLAIDRARLEGRRMAHFPDKAAQDAKNLRDIAKTVPDAKHREWLNELAGKFEAAGS